jgi:signal transduction histidine kinase
MHILPSTYKLIFYVCVALAIIGVVGIFYMLGKQKAGGGKNGQKGNAYPGGEQELSAIILSGIEDGVVLIDDQKTIQLFNPGAALISGWDAKEATRLDVNLVLRLIDSKDNPYNPETNPITTVFTKADTLHDDNAILLTKTDQHVEISLSVSPILDENKRVTSAVAVFRNTHEQRAEEQQRAEFISTASHEMRTPVAAIEGYLSLALNDKVATIDSRARGYIEKAHTNTQHLGQLFQDLLTSAKAEDGRLTSHPQVVEMGEFLQQLEQDVKFSAEKKGLSTEFVVGSSDVVDASVNNVVKPLYYAFADPDRIREVITNLFDNACKYTESGKITLGLTGDPSVVQLYIKDTGQGIPAEDVGHLFQKFYRVDNSATRTIGGTGLGLFICRKIVELYNGHIWVESEAGKGSTFFINLPRLADQKAEQLLESAKDSPAAPAKTVLPSVGSI